MFYAISGLRDCPGGIIQSSITPLRPMVLLALALDNPSWSLNEDKDHFDKDKEWIN